MTRIPPPEGDDEDAIEAWITEVRRAWEAGELVAEMPPPDGDDMDHVVVRIGDQDEVYGTVESTPRGFRYHPVTPEKRGQLMSFITACHDGQDNRDGALYGRLPPAEFLRRLPHRFSGYGAWAYIVDYRWN